MSKKNYNDLVNSLVQLVGGKENVNSLYHCITRLRFSLKDTSIADRETIKTTKGVLSLVEANGQFQIVIGNEVADVYDAMQAIYHFSNPMGDGDAIESSVDEGNIIIKMFNKLATIFNPIVPALAGAGMLKAVLVVLTTYGLMSADSSTYKILSAAGNSVFYFLPLFLAVSSSKTFKCSSFVSLAIVAALMEPNFTGLMEAVGDQVDFLGIPTILMGYSGTVIPAILSIFIYSKLEILLKKFIPKSLEIFLSSMLALIIMVPLTVIVIGPIGVTLGNGLGDLINYLNNTSGLISGAFIGGGWTFLVMIGIHWGVVPVMVNNLSTLGYDTIRPMIAAATFASAGVALGAFFRMKNKENKALAFSALFPALLGGITEPIVYGISVKYKKALIAQIIAGIVAGGFMGAFGTKAIVYVFPALTTLPAFFGDTFVIYCIGIAIAFFLAAGLTYIFGIDEEPDVTEEKSVGITHGELDLSACVEGTVIALEQVKDPLFSTKAMGDGIAIIPSKGVLYAPTDGEITVAFPTGHAIGMVSNNGTEILMHIGLDTVNMQGKGFASKVKVGKKVKKGDILVEFSISEIEKAGYETTTMMVVTNMNAVESLDYFESDKASINNRILHVKMKGA